MSDLDWKLAMIGVALVVIAYALLRIEWHLSQIKHAYLRRAGFTVD